jgi:hypothetical protein
VGEGVRAWSQYTAVCRGYGSCLPTNCYLDQSDYISCLPVLFVRLVVFRVLVCPWKVVDRRMAALKAVRPGVAMSRKHVTSLSQLCFPVQGFLLLIDCSGIFASPGHVRAMMIVRSAARTAGAAVRQWMRVGVESMSAVCDSYLRLRSSYILSLALSLQRAPSFVFFPAITLVLFP